MVKSQINKLANRVAFSDYLFFILALFTCTYFVYRDFGIRMIFGYAMLGVVVMLHIIRRFCNRSMLQIDAVRAAFLLLVLVVFVSFLRPDSRHDSDTTSYVIAMLICTCYLVLSRPGEKECRWVMNVLNITALAFAIYVIFFVLFEDLFWKSVYHILSETAAEYLEYYVPRGYSVSIGGCTYTNYILFFGMACNCGALMTSQKWDKQRIISLLACILFFIAIVLVGRRGEVLGIVLTGVVLFVISGDGRKRWIRLGILVGSAVLLLGLVMLCLPLLKKVDVLYRYVMTIEKMLSGQDITSGRIQLYQWAVALFQQNPVFGAGWGQFSNHITPEFRAIHGEGVADVHCIYLQFLCETGIIGAILIVAPMFYIYFQTLRQFVRVFPKKGTDENTNSVICLNGVSLVIQTFLLVMGIYDPCFERLIFWCFYALAVGFSATALKLEGYNLGCNKVFKKQGNM